MQKRIANTLFALAAVAAFALGGSALAGAAATGSTGATGASGSAGGLRPVPPVGDPSGTPPDMASHTAINPNEHLLSGDVAAKVTAAASAKVVGAVDRVETDEGGVYEAHITKRDGTHVAVKVNKQYEVTGVDDMSGPPAGGPGAGMPGGQR